MVSRDPTDYTPTTHFMQQCKYRDAPRPSPEIAARCIEHGDCSETADRYPDNTIKFEHDGWRTIAGLMDTPPHRLITIYSVNAHAPGEHGSVWDTSAEG